MTFPVGKSADPWNWFPLPTVPKFIGTFEYPVVRGLLTKVGLYTTTFVAEDGAKITFPFGASVADSQLEPDVPMGPTFENPDAEREYVLYIPIFAPVARGLMTTFPFGKSTPEPKSERP